MHSRVLKTLGICSLFLLLAAPVYADGRSAILEEQGLEPEQASAEGFPASPLPSTDFLLIPDSTPDTVGMYDPFDGTYLGDLITVPLVVGTISTPICALLGPDGMIYVSDQVQDTVFRFNLDGSYVDIFADGTDGLNNIRGMDFRGNLLYVTSGDDYVAVFDGPHSRLADFINDGSDPFDIFFLPDGRALLSDIGGAPDSVRLYNSDGTLASTVFSSNFPQQTQSDPVLGGDFLNAGFSSSTITDFDLAGTIYGTFSWTNGRGIYRLGNGNLLATNSTGVWELDGTTGAPIQQEKTGSCRFIEFVGDLFIDSELQLSGQTFITKSLMDFTVCYTNVSGTTLGDDETLTPQLRALLFANGKSAGDFSTLLDPIPILDPGEVWCDTFSATVPPTNKSKKVQKILRAPMRVEVRVAVDAVVEPTSADYVAFRIEERNNDGACGTADQYWLIDNDEGHDINTADGFGGTTAPGVELGYDDTVFGNEGFFAPNSPNQEDDVSGTYQQGPPNAGAQFFLCAVDFGMADFGAVSGASVAMVGVYHDDGTFYPDFSSPIYGPTPFSPMAANSISGGDHGQRITISPAESVGALEPIWTLYFHGAGRDDRWAIDNPTGNASGAGTVAFEASFSSEDGFLTANPIGGNLITAYSVDDPLDSNPAAGHGLTPYFSKWGQSVLKRVRARN